MAERLTVGGALLSLSIGNAFGTAVAAKPVRDRHATLRWSGRLRRLPCDASLAWRATRYALTRFVN
jgi:hypothetical protein